MPAMCMRFWPGWSWLKQAVEEQTYGKVLAARFRRDSAMPAWSQQGTYSGGQDLGGALFDLHIHDTRFRQPSLRPPGGCLLLRRARRQRLDQSRGHPIRLSRRP